MAYAAAAVAGTKRSVPAAFKVSEAIVSFPARSTYRPRPRTMLQQLLCCCAPGAAEPPVDEVPDDPVAKIKELETKAALLHKQAQQQNKEKKFDGEGPLHQPSTATQHRHPQRLSPPHTPPHTCRGT
jgi:hypothetical protein